MTIASSPTTTNPIRSPAAPIAWINRTTPRISSQMPKITAIVWTDLPGLNVSTTPKATVMTPSNATNHHARPTDLTAAAASALVELDTLTSPVRTSA